MTDRSELTPGSPLSEVHGCICPTMDNARGRGVQITTANGTETMFWINGACPVHGRPEPEAHSVRLAEGSPEAATTPALVHDETE